MMRGHPLKEFLFFDAKPPAGVSNFAIAPLKKTRLELRRGREMGSIHCVGTAAYVDGIVGWFDNLL